MVCKVRHHVDEVLIWLGHSLVKRYSNRYMAPSDIMYDYNVNVLYIYVKLQSYSPPTNETQI